MVRKRKKVKKLEKKPKIKSPRQSIKRQERKDGHAILSFAHIGEYLKENPYDPSDDSKYTTLGEIRKQMAEEQELATRSGN